MIVNKISYYTLWLFSALEEKVLELEKEIKINTNYKSEIINRAYNNFQIAKRILFQSNKLYENMISNKNILKNKIIEIKNTYLSRCILRFEVSKSLFIEAKIINSSIKIKWINLNELFQKIDENLNKIYKYLSN